MTARSLCGDFTRLDDIAQTVRAIAPDVIVNAAAHTAVDKAESEPERVRTINALAPATLAREARKLGAWLVHYSTDYVFDGSGSKPWVETDPIGPLNVYGSTKLEGEEAILASGCHHLIFRTSWVFAARGGNFAKTMLRLAQERDRLTVIDDQMGAPTGADLLADVTAHAIRTALQRPKLIRPLSSGCSRRDLVVRLCPLCIEFGSSSWSQTQGSRQKIFSPYRPVHFPHPPTRPEKFAPGHQKTAKHLRFVFAFMANWCRTHAH